MGDEQKGNRTLGEAGWHASRYNVSASIPDSTDIIVANLTTGTCVRLNQMEQYLLSVVEELDENHPAANLLRNKHLIANCDERAMIEAQGRLDAGQSHSIGLTICPTMGCNFDCPYCFENHGSGPMSEQVQDDVVALAERMLKASRARKFDVNWFGGEPLLYPQIIESLSERFMALSERYGASYSAGIVTNGYLLTQEIADMLGRVKVEGALITIDGIGATHDATRHLVGGGPTFDRIVSNLRTLRLPFKVQVRHNIHEGNFAERDELDALVAQIAEESGNVLFSDSAAIADSDPAEQRGRQVDLLGDDALSETWRKHDAANFTHGRGSFCCANTFWSLGIDEKGNLHKCWEAVDKTELSFGTAHDWDPDNPLETASNPDKFTCYLNTTGPVPYEACKECVFLPVCVGGCPFRRLFGKGRMCPPYKDDPETFVRALYEARQKKEG